MNRAIIIPVVLLNACASSVVITNSVPSNCVELGAMYERSLVDEKDAIRKLQSRAREKGGNLLFMPDEQHENVIIMSHENAGKIQYERQGVAYKCKTP